MIFRFVLHKVIDTLGVGMYYYHHFKPPLRQNIYALQFAVLFQHLLLVQGYAVPTNAMLCHSKQLPNHVHRIKEPAAGALLTLCKYRPKA